MKLLTPKSMVEKSTIVSLTFDRKDKSLLNALSKDGVIITRSGTGNEIEIQFSVPDGHAFSVQESDMDFDEIRGRTKSVLRCDRKQNENLILKLDLSDERVIESDSIYIYYAGGDEFILMAEPQFNLTNKIYQRRFYNRSDVELSDELRNEIREVNGIDNKGLYSRDKAVRYRNIINMLDEIIGDQATNQLRHEAISAKRDLENSLKEIRVLKNKSHLSKAFQDQVKQIKFQNMMDFIEAHHGKNALSIIESQSIRQATDKLRASDEVIKSAISENDSLEAELEMINDKLSKILCKDELNRFINRDMPPNMRISACGKCGKKPRLNMLELKTKAKKAFEIRCQCGNSERGTKPAITAISKWNIAQGDAELSSIEGLDFSGLSNDEIKSKLREIDRFTHMVARSFTIKSMIEGDRYHKSNNKIKGMNTVLIAINEYAKKVTNKN